MTLSSLIERVKKADGPDREIDCALEWFFYDATTKKVGADGKRYVRNLGSWDTFEPIFDYNEARNAYTRLLDAALALVERKLPDHFPGVQKYYNGWGAELVYPEPRVDRHGKHFAICSDHNRFPNPALAVLCALLRALQTSEATNGE